MKKVITFGLALSLVLMVATSVSASGYTYIEQTEDKEVIEMTEEVGMMYGICPELLQALIFYESSNQSDARNGSCYGYMQVNENIHAERAKELGVDLHEPKGNIITGTDYLAELAQEYGDVSLVLMKYHGESDAEEKYNDGRISRYAENVLTLSEKLERNHGK